MDYLSSNQVIHRDLATRNCLLDDELVVKISDFGLARSLGKDNCCYYVSQQAATPLPLRWMAIESLAFNKYSVQSDVWSFGVVLWELLTRGETPYGQMDMWHNGLLRYLTKGFRLAKPKFCPFQIYLMMLRCWKNYPKGRPTFLQLKTDIQFLLTKWKQRKQ